MRDGVSRAGAVDVTRVSVRCVRRDAAGLGPNGDEPGQWTVVKRRLAARSSS